MANRQRKHSAPASISIAERRELMKQKKENNFPLMARYMKGNIRYFVAAILCSVLSTVCNSLTPQIISVTIDSILGKSD